jgi:hypothetical protein
MGVNPDVDLRSSTSVYLSVDATIYVCIGYWRM